MIRRYHWLGAVPAIAMLGGVPFANRVEPFVFGFPFLLAWIVIWVVATSATMALIYFLDSAQDRKESAADPLAPRSTDVK